MGKENNTNTSNSTDTPKLITSAPKPDVIYETFTLKNSGEKRKSSNDK